MSQPEGVVKNGNLLGKLPGMREVVNNLS